MGNGMPPPMTDPLQMSPADSQAMAHQQVAEEGFKKEHEAISRGMPARNMKNWLLGVLGIAAVAYLLFPSLTSKEPKPVEVLAKETAPGASIIEALKGNSKPAAPVVPQEIPTPKTGLVGGVSGTTGLPIGAPPSAVNEIDLSEKKHGDITASSMEAAEVVLTRRDDPNRSVKTEPRDPRVALGEALEKQSELIGKALSGDKTTPSGAERLNAQDEFLFRAATKTVEAPIKMAAAMNSASLYQGTIVRVVLDRSLNTDTPGAIRGRVTSDVFDSLTQQILVIPRGSVVVGSYMNSLLIGQARILIATERLILPNGKSISLLGTPASDMQGASGIEAKVDNHFWDMFKTSIVLGAASLILPKDQQSISVSDSAQGSSRTAGSIIGSSIYDTIKRVTERNGVIKPTGTIDLGEPFTLMLSRDVQMEPYQR